MPTTRKYSVADNFHVSSNSFHVVSRLNQSAVMSSS
nr:MAG TPA: hypothetical protein [Microviridae sp.]